MTFSIEWLLVENAKAKELWAKKADDYKVREACANRAFKCPECGTRNLLPGYGVTYLGRSPVTFCGGCDVMVAEIVLDQFLLR